MPRLAAIRRIRRRYWVAAGIAAAILLFLWLLPIGLRLGAVHWLEGRGLSAEVENVDLNLFTGRLAVDGVRVANDAGDGFRIGHAAVHLRYLPLFGRQLHLAGLTVRDTAVDVRRAETLTVAGFEIAGDPEASPEDTPDPGSPWGFGLDSADVEDLTMRYHEPGFSREVTLATSTTADVATWQPQIPIPLNANLRLGEATVAVEGSLRPFGDRIVGDLELRVDGLTLEAVAPLVEGRGGIAELAGTLNGDLGIAVDYAGDSGLDLELTGKAGLAGGHLVLPDTATIDGGIDWDGTVEARLLHPDAARRIHADGVLALSDAGVGLPAAGYTVQAAGLTWTGEAGLDPEAEGMPADAAPPVHAAGDIRGQEVRVTDRRVGRELARMAGLEATGLRLTGLDALRVEQLAGNRIQALERAPGAPEQEDYPRILTADRLEIAGIDLRERQRLTIERAAAEGARGLLLLTAEGGGEIDAWLPPAGDEGQGEPVLRVTVGTVALTGNNRLRIEDRGVQPPMILELSELQARLSDLDTGAPDQASELTLSAQVGRYGRIEAEGELRPFADPVSLRLTAQASSVNLAPASGYLRRALERRVERGTLDAQVDLTVDRGNIDGLADLTLRKFRLGGVIGDSGAVERSLGLPLDRALSLLRDDEGSIGIELPLGGDLQNPQFSFDRVIRQAIFEGLQVAILSYYSPLGVLKAADKLVDLATALRFEPVAFEAGAAGLTGEAGSYLDRMTGLLEKRPEARLVICGHAVPADREALDLPASGAEDADAEAREAARRRLLRLAEERTVAVSQYLVEAGIDSDRLVLCNPDVDTDPGAQPRTEVSL